MTDITALIERVERATGPDSELFWGAFSVVWPEGAVHEIWLRFAKLLDNEAWLDAAMSLKVDGQEYEISTIYGLACVTMPLNVDGVEPITVRRKDGNVILAFVECALKARKVTA